MIGSKEDTQHSFANIVGAATTTVKPRAGVLRRIVINTPVANGTITIYDNASAASGTKVGTITLPGTLTSDTDVVDYDVRMADGITVVTTGASLNVTVVYD